MNGLEAYQNKARAVIEKSLEVQDLSERELVVLAAAMQIVKYKPSNIILEELESAKSYIKKYKERGDPEYLEFAKQEMRHAKKPLSILAARINTATPSEIDLYNQALETVKELETHFI